MDRFKHSLVPVAALLISISLGVESSDHDHADEHRHQQEAHVHGLAELTLVLEGDILEVNLTSPATNIVGFEHSASTPEQRQTVEKAKNVLETSRGLFSFDGTSCELQRTDVDVSAVADSGKEGHKHHAEDDHHENEDGAADHDTHSEIKANYHFACQQGEDLTTISVQLFDRFPGIEVLNAIWVTDIHQASAKLTVKKNMIRLR